MPKRITLKNTGFPENDDASDRDYSSEENHDRRVNLLDALGRLLKHKKIIFGFVILVMFLTTIRVLFIPNLYKSQATLLPSGKIDRLSHLRQLAGLGIDVDSDENSSELFPVILRSQLIRDAILAKTYSFDNQGKNRSLTLAGYFGETNPDLQRLNLDNITDIRVTSNRVIEIGVSTIYPELSQAIVGEYITQLENYNRHKRRSRARENEQYLARQIELTEADLALAEDRLENFQLVNSDWAITADPTILKELARLKRDAEARSKALLFLMQEHEMARQEAHKDIPIVRVLDEPSLPVLKTGPHRKMIVILAGIAAFLAAILAILLVEAINQKRRGPDRKSYDYLRRSFSQAFPRTERVVNRITRTVRDKIEA